MARTNKAERKRRREAALTKISDGHCFADTVTSATAASLHQLAEHHRQSVEEPLSAVAGVAAWW